MNIVFISPGGNKFTYVTTWGDYEFHFCMVAGFETLPTL